MYITLDDAKKHLNLTDEFFTDDDGYILTLITAAECAVSNEIDRPLSQFVDSATGILSPALRHAILMLIGSAYNFRESITVQNIKKVPVYDMLLAPYRKHSVS